MRFDHSSGAGTSCSFRPEATATTSSTVGLGRANDQLHNLRIHFGNLGTFILSPTDGLGLANAQLYMHNRVDFGNSGSFISPQKASG